jgi:hypothetical protein
MKKFLKKLIAALYEQAWTIAGTILVQSWGIKISVATLIIVLFGAVIKKEMDDSD